MIEDPNDYQLGSHEILLSPTDIDVIDTGGPQRARWSGRRWVATVAVAATVLAAGGGIAYGVVLQRADVKLAKVLDATSADPPTGVTLSVETDAASLESMGQRDAATAELLQRGDIRVGWGAGGASSLRFSVDRKPALVATTAGETSTFIVDWDALSTFAWGADARTSLERVGRSATGRNAAILDALLGGRPLALKSNAAAPGTDLLSPKVLDSFNGLQDEVSSALRDTATVRKGGGDEYGQRYVVDVPLSALWDRLRPSLEKRLAAASSGLLGGRGASSTGKTEPLPAELRDATLSVEMWERDGVVARTRIQLGDLIRRSMGAKAPDSLDFAIVAVPDHDAVFAAPTAALTLTQMDLFGLSVLMFSPPGTLSSSAGVGRA